MIDGTGAERFVADIAIDDGRIVAIGANLVGDKTIDACGLVVAPGFIDIHTHYDAQVFWDRWLTPSSLHGVTTVVAGNCGFTLAPTREEDRELVMQTLEYVEDMAIDTLREGIDWSFSSVGEYLDLVAKKGVAVNFAAYVGHSAVRAYVMGSDAYELEATEKQIGRMCEVVTKSLDEGAIGFSSSFSPGHFGVGGMPVPSRAGTAEEFTSLVKTVASLKGLVSLVPGENCTFENIYRLQQETASRFTYAGIISSPDGSHRQLLDLNARGWKNGQTVWPQVTSRPVVMSFSLAKPTQFHVNTEFNALVSASIAQRRAAYADPSWRARASVSWRAERVVAGSTANAEPLWGRLVISESLAHPELIDRQLNEVALERGVSPLDLLLDLAMEEPNLDLHVKYIMFNDDVEAVKEILREPGCTMGLSDAGAHVGQLCDAPQATDFLGNWVRDRSLMGLEEAVRKLTGTQAEVLALTDRGYIREGAWADIVVFDPQTISPGPLRRVRDFPAGGERLTADSPSGIVHVLVNGSPIIQDGNQVKDAQLAGQVLRSFGS